MTGVFPAPKAPKKVKERKQLKRSRMKKRPRPESETLRIYGPPERREFVQSLACIVARVLCDSACQGPIENAHTVGGGTGRKADANTIVPLCRRHHRLLHQYGPSVFQSTYSLDLEAEAAATEAVYQAFVGTQLEHSGDSE